MKFNKMLVVALLGLLLFSGQARSTQTSSVNPDTGAGTWAMQSNGVNFSMTQIMPDQARAFYVNRGFKLEQIEDYATSCVYMTVIRNDSAPGAIRFVLRDWSIMYEGQERPPRKITDWIEKLKESGGTDPALIAFRWAQFPPEQEYEPGGDWNQGMLSTGVPPGSRFDVIARWQMGGKVFEGILRNVHCAK